MNIGNVVQVGEAIRHKPLPSLTPIDEQVNLNDEESHTSNKPISSPVLGGFVSGGQLAWRSIGPTIEIFDPVTCLRQAAWTFGSILRSSSAKVTSVCGIGVGTVTHVAVGVDLGCERPNGMVGILSLRRSRITRAFHFEHKVTNVCMITSGEKLVDPSTLAYELRYCQGLMAVSTAHACLFLVDIALDLGGDEVTSDEVSPAPYTSITIPDVNAGVNRSNAIANKHHPLLCLSEKMSYNGHFQYLGPDECVLYEAKSQDVDVSSMVYIPQIASLVIGYNFGSFQIINLSLIAIDCAFPYEDNLPPVFSIAYQEPENDPRTFVYLWVCRSFNIRDEAHTAIQLIESESSASCSLYAMNYEKKEWIEGHGLWYQSLSSISPRFEFDTKGFLNPEVFSSSPSCMFSAVTVTGATPSSSSASPLSTVNAVTLSSSDEESGPVPELSLCLFCWENNFLEQGRITSQHFIAIFDINQWYQAQMPHSIHLEEDKLCPFMSFHTLDKVPKSMNENLLSAIPWIGSWSRFSSKMSFESDWFPSSLSYELLLLTSEGMVTYKCPSVQQQAISFLMQQGPRAIVGPHPSHAACVFAGLLSQECLIISNTGGSSLMQERENLLTVALEHHLLPFLIQCINEFSEGLFSHLGCSLEAVLKWAWSKLYTLKTSYDSLCAPLFSSSPEILTVENLVTLHQNLTYLSHLSTIFAAIRDNSTDVTSNSARNLNGRLQVVQLCQMHLQALLWFYHCGLLPQYISDEDLEENCVPYPFHILQETYNTRYSAINKLDSSLNPSDVLLIDALIEEAREELMEIWEKERGIIGIYPPPSLHALLSMYMLPEVSFPTKHRIVQYLFLDLANILSDGYSTVVEELVKFPSSFSLSPSLIKITQAFWLIDHGSFQEGLDWLMHPLVNPDDITSSQHRRIIKAFLFQGEEKLAATYNQIRQPPTIELDDILLNLSILLANGRIREAFHYQRSHQNRFNAKELLNHMFTGCERMLCHNLESVIHLPMSVMEEEVFINYLQSSKHSRASDILLAYYVKQSRFNELNAFQCNSTEERQTALTSLVRGYVSHLPNLKTKSSNQKQTVILCRQPQPLSARIRQSHHSTPRSKGTVNRLNALQTDPKRPIHQQSYTPFRSKLQRRQALGSWREEMGLQSPADKDAKNTSCIVFPTILDKEVDEQESSLNMDQLFKSSLTPTTLGQKRKKICDVSQKEIVSSFIEEVLKPTATPKSTHKSLSVLSLLKTPPVHNASFTSQKDFNIETPQSILKVKKILQRSLSPSDASETSGFCLPSIRSVTSRVKLDSPKDTIVPLEFGSITPKQLRFELPSNVSHKEENKVIMSVNISRRGTSLNMEEDDADVPSPRKPLPSYIEKDVESTDEEMESDSISELPQSSDVMVVEMTKPNKNLDGNSSLNSTHDSSIHRNSKDSFLSLDDSFHSLVDDVQQEVFDALEIVKNENVLSSNHVESFSIEKSLAINKTLKELIEYSKMSEKSLLDDVSNTVEEDSLSPSFEYNAKPFALNNEKEINNASLPSSREIDNMQEKMSVSEPDILTASVDIPSKSFMKVNTSSMNETSYIPDTLKNASPLHKNNNVIYPTKDKTLSMMDHSQEIDTNAEYIPNASTDINNKDSLNFLHQSGSNYVLNFSENKNSDTEIVSSPNRKRPRLETDSDLTFKENFHTLSAKLVSIDTLPSTSVLNLDHNKSNKNASQSSDGNQLNLLDVDAKKETSINLQLSACNKVSSIPVLNAASDKTNCINESFILSKDEKPIRNKNLSSSKLEEKTSLESSISSNRNCAISSPDYRKIEAVPETDMATEKTSCIENGVKEHSLLSISNPVLTKSVPVLNVDSNKIEVCKEENEESLKSENIHFKGTNEISEAGQLDIEEYVLKFSDSEEDISEKDTDPFVSENDKLVLVSNLEAESVPSKGEEHLQEHSSGSLSTDFNDQVSSVPVLKGEKTVISESAVEEGNNSKIIPSNVSMAEVPDSEETVDSIVKNIVNVSTSLTPVRKSRRMSGLGCDTSLQTSLRKSRRLSPAKLEEQITLESSIPSHTNAAILSLNKGKIEELPVMVMASQKASSIENGDNEHSLNSTSNTVVTESAPVSNVDGKIDGLKETNEKTDAVHPDYEDYVLKFSDSEEESSEKDAALSDSDKSKVILISGLDVETENETSEKEKGHFHECSIESSNKVSPLSVLRSEDDRLGSSNRESLIYDKNEIALQDDNNISSIQVNDNVCQVDCVDKTVEDVEESIKKDINNPHILSNVSIAEVPESDECKEKPMSETDGSIDLKEILNTPNIGTPLTPARRSRRLSGLGCDNELNSLHTPLRRSRRLSGASAPSTPAPKSTPRRRVRRESECSEGHVESHLEPLQEGGLITSNNNDAYPSPVSIPVLQTPSKENASEIPSRSRRKSLSNDLPSTPEITVRRSARLSCTPDVLGTIMEDKTLSLQSSPLSKNTRKTPVRSRRKSLNQTLNTDLNLETIQEDSEFVNDCNSRLAVDSTDSISSRTRRRSISGSDNIVKDSTPDSNTSTPQRTRRRSLRSTPLKENTITNLEENVPKSTKNKTIKDTLEKTEYLPIPEVDSSNINAVSILLKRKSMGISKLDATTFRKSINSLSKIEDYDISLEEEKISRRKSRLKDDAASTVVVIRKPKRATIRQIQSEDDAVENNNEEEDMEDMCGEQIDLLSDQSDGTPVVNYKQIQITPSSEVINIQHLIHEKRKSKNIKSKKRLLLSTVKDYPGFSDEEEVEEEKSIPKGKKARKKSPQNQKKGIVKGTSDSEEVSDVDKEKSVFSPVVQEKKPRTKQKT